MEKRPYTPPRLRRLSADEVRALEERYGKDFLGKDPARLELGADVLPKKGAGDHGH